MPTNDVQSSSHSLAAIQNANERKRPRFSFNLIQFCCRPIALFQWESDCSWSEVSEYSHWRSILTSAVVPMLERIVIFVADLEVDGEKQQNFENIQKYFKIIQ